MMVPPLSRFIRSVPKSLISHPPTLWLEDCLAGGAGYIVLVDEAEFPVRVLSLHDLLGLLEGGNPVATARLKRPDVYFDAAIADDIQPATWIEATAAIALMPLQHSLATAAQMVAAAPATCWIVIDQQQRYVGLLDTTQLLACALTQTDPAPASASPDAPTAQQQASQSNTALLTYLGHELKTPLTSLLGLSSLLRTERLGPLNTRQARYVSLIQQHCRRLAAWVNTLIDLGRIESGTLRLIPDLVDLSTLWREAYRQAALRVGSDVPDADDPAIPPLLQRRTVPLTLVADPHRLQQMLTCLMQTALATQASPAETDQAVDFPLLLELWDTWIAITVQGLEEAQFWDHLSSPESLRLPFPTTVAPSTPIAAEMGHWLEWLLVRKLAQLQGGELVLVAHPRAGLQPTLLLPVTALPAATSPDQLLLFVTPSDRRRAKDQATIHQIQRQASQLNARLLVTHDSRDALDIVTHLPLVAILVMVDSEQRVSELATLKAHPATTGVQVIALVPPRWSALLGELAADREVLWPAEPLGDLLWRSPPTQLAPNRLTILYLNSPEQTSNARNSSGLPPLNLPNLFHDCGCRVLEVDDLEQAGLLRRVWHPDVAVLDPAITNPRLYLQALSQMPELAALPLITLTLSATQAAHSLPSLTVYPCLVGDTAWNTPEASDRLTAWLMQVLQTAATPRP